MSLAPDEKVSDPIIYYLLSGVRNWPKVVSEHLILNVGLRES